MQEESPILIGIFSLYWPLASPKAQSKCRKTRAILPISQLYFFKSILLSFSTAIGFSISKSNSLSFHSFFSIVFSPILPSFSSTIDFSISAYLKNLVPKSNITFVCINQNVNVNFKCLVTTQRKINCIFLFPFKPPGFCCSRCSCREMTHS